MRDLNKELCYVMHKFVSEHIGNIRTKANKMCDEWKDHTRMLKDIKKDAKIASWALYQLCTSDMDKDYTSEMFSFDKYIDANDYEVEIFKIVDRSGKERYFKIDYKNDLPIEVKRKTKMVEISFWEDQRTGNIISAL